jgi:hypothetical protein
MTVIPISSKGLTPIDERLVLAFGYQLLHEGLAGACVPVRCDDGERMLVILNPSNDDILFAFGKNGEGYYVVDWDGYPVTEYCHSITEALFAFDRYRLNEKKTARQNGDIVLNTEQNFI